MGRSALMMVLALSVAFGTIMISVNGANEHLVAAHTGYFKYAAARNIARFAVHATLRAYDRGLAVIPTSGAIRGGTYHIDLGASEDTLWIAATGTFAESSFTMRSKLLRFTKPFPTSRSAIGIRAQPVHFSLSGGAQVDGHNYDSLGVSQLGWGNLPGVTTMTSADSVNVYNSGSTNIDGSPPVAVDTLIADPGPFVDEYRSNADYLYNTSGSYAGATWGSPTAPVIVYCNAGDDTAFSIKFSGNVVGYGILVVRGNVQFTGNFAFFGLVVVDGFNTQVKFGASGTPQIVGGLVVSGKAGASVMLNGSGSKAKIKYSSQSLTKARNVGKLRYYSILDWYE